jgi:DNA polymerase-3 subunit beta
MQFTSNEQFTTALRTLASVVPSRSSKPICQCVRIEALDGHVTLHGTDLDRHLLIDIDATITTPGAVCVPFQKLSEIMTGHKGTALEFIAADGKVKLTGGGSSMTLHTSPASEFPAFPVADADAKPATLPAIDLLTALRQVEDATAKEASRFSINGVLLDCEGSPDGKDKNTYLVATDGRRMHRSQKLDKLGKKNTIIPASTVGTLTKLLTDGDVSVCRGEDGQIRFSGSNWTLSSAIVEGNFPPYRDVIPKQNDTTVTVDSLALASAVRRASVTANEESRSTTFEIGKDTITLSATTPEVGSSEITVNATIEGPPVKIGFNGGYIVQALATCPGEAKLELSKSNKPITIRGTGGNINVVMPVNLQ